MKEVKIMCSLSHPCTVRLYAWTKRPPAMVMELAATDLRQYYQGDAKEKLGEYSIVSGLEICLDSAKGMLYIHSAGLIHRDLKSMNIMVTKDKRGKVADYGESREQDTSLTMTSTGTALWMAPEVSKNERYDSKADSFSFGVILYEVMKRDLPYADMKNINGIGLAVKVALDGLRPTIEDGWHPLLQELMRGCYEEDPGELGLVFQYVRVLFTSNEAHPPTHPPTHPHSETTDLR